jgi:hypothetical protein
MTGVELGVERFEAEVPEVVAVRFRVREEEEKEVLASFVLFRLRLSIKNCSACASQLEFREGISSAESSFEGSVLKESTARVADGILCVPACLPFLSFFRPPMTAGSGVKIGTPFGPKIAVCAPDCASLRFLHQCLSIISRVRGSLAIRS